VMFTNALSRLRQRLRRARGQRISPVHRHQLTVAAQELGEPLGSRSALAMALASVWWSVLPLTWPWQLPLAWP
jgi:putative effector of murein hydrolase